MRWLALFLYLALGGAAFAVEPSEILSDPALEARARAISEDLRCLVCQNQSIDDSHAGLAHDLRVLVRERLAAGDSDAAVKAYLVSRYGDFVLLKPPLQADTLLLWGLPFLVLTAGALSLLIGRRHPVAPVAPLSDAEQAAVDRITSGTRTHR